MKLFLRAAAIACTLLGFFGCAQRESEDNDAKEQLSLDAWMSLHINTNGNTVAEKQENGMYVQWLQRADGGATRPITGDWVEINYTVMLMDGYDPVTERGRVVITRSEEEARLQGTFTVYTHYVPHFIIHNEQNYIMPGQQKALSLMKKGDKVRLYLTSRLANGGSALTYNNGYEGQISLEGSYGISSVNAPVIVEMELVDVITDPTAREQGEVVAFARDEWGLEERDSIADHMYLRIEKYVEGSDTIFANSTISGSFYYVGKFLRDGFVFATNIDSVATRLGRTVDEINTASFTPSVQTTRFIEAFSKAFSSELITYDCTFTVIFTSAYAFGSEGSVSDDVPSTIIQPYTPVMYEIIVPPQETDEEDGG